MTRAPVPADYLDRDLSELCPRVRARLRLPDTPHVPWADAVVSLAAAWLGSHKGPDFGELIVVEAVGALRPALEAFAARPDGAEVFLVTVLDRRFVTATGMSWFYDAETGRKVADLGSEPETHTSLDLGARCRRVLAPRRLYEEVRDGTAV